VNSTEPTSTERLDVAESSRESTLGQEGQAPRAIATFFHDFGLARAELERFQKLKQVSRAVVVALDPREVRLPNWFRTDDMDDESRLAFEVLKESISQHGLNVQPIKVAPLGGADVDDFLLSKRHIDCCELVFGFSRLRACRELGLPVVAIVEQLSHVEQLRQFVVDHCCDRRWRPWRLGAAINHGIDSGAFPSIRKAAHGLSLRLIDASLPVSLDKLPSELRTAFRRVQIKPRHAKALIEAYARHHDPLARSASRMDFSSCKSANAVLTKLLGSAT
jgi:ParB family chromosome partitioning protein